MKYLFIILAVIFSLQVGTIWAQEEEQPPAEQQEEEFPVEEEFQEQSYDPFQQEEFSTKDDAGIDQFNIANFEQNLMYIRGVMVERNERAVMAQAHIKIDKALHGFLQTDFMKQYKELKLEAESLAAAFKAKSSRIPPDDVIRVKKGYDIIAEKFNRQLEEIKRDFLDRKKMKMIKNNRDMYSNSLQYKLGELKDAYSNDFERVVAEVTGRDTYSAIPLAAILSMIKLAQDFAEYIINANYEAKRVKEQHLDQYFIQPYRFKSWMEVEMISSDPYSDENPYKKPKEDEWDNNDPFEDDPNPEIDSAKPAKKKKKKNEDW